MVEPIVQAFNVVCVKILKNAKKDFYVLNLR